uniref:Protein FAR1-RELATED SEQUENCE n=1 Tax=Arundo donax TaxID=35708 RepID=A0A0A9BNI3_ARUDO
MESASSDDPLRDQNVDHSDDHTENYMSFDVSSQFVDMNNNSTKENLENSEPFVGMEFESEEAAKVFYMAYASRVGFSMRISKSRRSRNDESIIMRRFVCSKEGFHQKKKNHDTSKRKRRRATIREGCNAMVEVTQKYYGRWVVAKLIKEHNHVLATPSIVRYVAPEEYAQLEPFIGMEFPSHEAAQTFYYAYASHMGFEVRIRLSRRSPKDNTFVMRRFVCTKEGSTPCEETNNENKRKRNRASLREGCQAAFEIVKKDQDQWVVSKLFLAHTHELAAVPDKVHYIQSNSEVVVLAKTSVLRENSIAPVLNPQVGELGTNTENQIPNDQELIEPCRSAFGVDDTQKLLGYFKRLNAENPSFSYAFQVNKNDCLTHAFWADAKVRTSYYYFGDAVTLETSFVDNEDFLPLVMLMGINHHLQSIMFGCALLTDCTEASYIWLLQNWITAMGSHHPTSLTTCYNEAISSAVAKVFPQTHHLYCTSQILNRCKENLANVYSRCAYFEEEFCVCINDPETTEMFESSWKKILDKYDLEDNIWLQSLYRIRQRWVPVYFRDVFTADLSATQRPESLRTFFKKYFNKRTALQVFISLFEHVMAGWAEREALEDLATSFTVPILRTPSNMLKQVSEIYTRTVFNIFEEEFIESLGYYISSVNNDGLIAVYKVTKEDSRVTFTVSYDTTGQRAQCSCCKFENSGVLCRHILRLFLALDVRAIPEFYILKRWTKEAKNGFVLDECLRYSELQNDALRYAREGSTSGEVFTFAQQTLQVAFSEVVHMKQQIVSRCTTQ